MHLSAPFMRLALLVFARLTLSARRALSARPSAAAPAAVDRRVRPRERASPTGWRSRRASGTPKKPVQQTHSRIIPLCKNRTDLGIGTSLDVRVGQIVRKRDYFLRQNQVFSNPVCYVKSLLINPHRKPITHTLGTRMDPHYLEQIFLCIVLHKIRIVGLVHTYYLKRENHRVFLPHLQIRQWYIY
jgi:hypothetical protein